MSDFHGLPTRNVENGHLRVEFLAEAGPRIVRLFLAGSDENQLVELPNLAWETLLGDFCVRGGHRLWHLRPNRLRKSAFQFTREWRHVRPSGCPPWS